MKESRPMNNMKKGKGEIPRPVIDITPEPLGMMKVHGGILKGSKKNK